MSDSAMTERLMSENFNEDERRQLAPYFSNADLPVFALSGMSETMKGAMFARYSRYSGSLRRMFLDEFAGEMPTSADAVFNDAEGDRAADLYKRIFLGYGDDSVAQLGGAHIACEFVSNVLTKVLQRGRLAAYLEQSTRYIPYDVPMPGGGYRYHRSDLLGPQFEHAMDTLFTTYSQLIPRVSAWVAEQYPAANGDDAAAHARAVKAKTFDLLRGLLPASALSHVGIFASGQAYESLLLHLAASPLPEANHYGEMMLTELKKVIPSFVQRVERPERGGRWIDFLAAQRANSNQWAARLGIDMGASDNGPSVRLLSYQGDERRLATALLFEAGTLGEPEIAGAVDGLDEEQLDGLIADLVGDRENRRHRPGRGFERLSYRFEIVSDYGAFRDLQRHRMLTCQWQTLGPLLGAEIPHEVDEAGAGDEFRAALEASHNEYDRLVDVGLAEHAPYALCLAYRIRYVLDLNAREAMQLIELRSGREGHPAYRAVAHAMWDEISRVHPRVAAAMTHVDRESEPRLERLSAEMRNQSR